ncbi:MAG: GH25 family lysozyme [Oscillospiraceae bacterium]
MKGLTEMVFAKKRAARLLAAVMSAVMAFGYVGTEVFAFTDPADIYENYKNGDHDSDDDYSDGDGSDEITEEEYDGDADVPDENESSETSSDNSDKEVKRPAEEVTITGYKTTVKVGDSFKIGYRLKPSKSDDTVTYKTSKKAVAKISSDGTVTAVGKGTAVITVTASSGVKDRFSLTVKEGDKSEEKTETDEDTSSDENAEYSEEEQSEAQPSKSDTSDKSKAKEIELMRSSVTLIEGETYQIKYSLYPKNCTDTVSFRTLRKSIASVDSSGLVTAVGEGNTRIVCTTGSGLSVKLSVTVVKIFSDEEKDSYEEENVEAEYDENGVLKPSKVVMDDESASLKIGETMKITGRVYPKGCSFTMSYKSSDKSVAKVSSKGVVTGVSEGSCVITATTDNGKTDELYVTVYGSVIMGIDVSKWNGEINWKKVKNSGMAGFAMIRASYGQEDIDPMLAANVNGCEKYDIPYGFYHYTYARSVSEAKAEAKFFLKTIKKYSPEYPVVLDIEEDFYKGMSKKKVTAIVTTFMEELEKAGYYAMIYSYATFFDDNLILDEIEDYDVWVACWGDEEMLSESYNYHYGMWQYSETGHISGIPEDVDLNYCYKDYRSIIRKYGLNNLS